MHERLQRQLQIDGAEMQERSEDLRDRSRLGEAPSKGRRCISAPSTLPTASKVASVARMELHPSPRSRVFDPCGEHAHHRPRAAAAGARWPRIARPSFCLG